MITFAVCETTGVVALQTVRRPCAIEFGCNILAVNADALMAQLLQ